MSIDVSFDKVNIILCSIVGSTPSVALGAGLDSLEVEILLIFGSLLSLAVAANRKTSCVNHISFHHMMTKFLLATYFPIYKFWSEKRSKGSKFTTPEINTRPNFLKLKKIIIIYCYIAYITETCNEKPTGGLEF